MQKMKKVNVKGKLSLGKETIVKLNNAQMSNVIGGSTGFNTNQCCATCFVSQGTLLCCA